VRMYRRNRQTAGQDLRPHATARTETPSSSIAILGHLLAVHILGIDAAGTCTMRGQAVMTIPYKGRDHHISFNTVIQLSHARRNVYQGGHGLKGLNRLSDMK